MQNKKGLQLAISTLILLVLGVVILIAIIIAVTGGFDTFSSTTDPFLNTAQSSAVKQACSIACQEQNYLALCCSKYEVGDEMIECLDERLGVSCDVSCENINCEEPQE